MEISFKHHYSYKSKRVLNVAFTTTSIIDRLINFSTIIILTFRLKKKIFIKYYNLLRFYIAINNYYKQQRSIILIPNTHIATKVLYNSRFERHISGFLLNTSKYSSMRKKFMEKYKS